MSLLNLVNFPKLKSNKAFAPEISLEKQEFSQEIELLVKSYKKVILMVIGDFLGEIGKHKKEDTWLFGLLGILEQHVREIQGCISNGVLSLKTNHLDMYSEIVGIMEDSYEDWSVGADNGVQTKIQKGSSLCLNFLCDKLIYLENVLDAQNIIFRSAPPGDLTFVGNSRISVVDGLKKGQDSTVYRMLEDLELKNGYGDPVHIKTSENFDFKKGVLSLYVELTNVSKCFLTDLCLTVNIDNTFVIGNDFEMTERTFKVEQLTSGNSVNLCVNFGINKFASGKIKLSLTSDMLRNCEKDFTPLQISGER
jgi:hypothetical protein